MCYYRANSGKFEVVKNCIETFCAWSGLRVNVDKFGVFWSRNVSRITQRHLRQVWPLQKLSEEAKYLGNRLFIGKNKKEIFSYMKDKSCHRIQGWKNRALSKAGKEILLKSIVQVVPSFIMTVFLHPKLLCEELKRMMKLF